MENDDTKDLEDSFDLSLSNIDIKPETYISKQIFQCQNCLRMGENSNFLVNRAFFIANVNVLEGMAKEKKGLIPEKDYVSDTGEILEKSYLNLVKEYKLSEEYQNLKEEDKKAFGLASFKFYKIFGYVCDNQSSSNVMTM